MSNHPATHYLEVLAGPSWKKENFLFLAIDDKKGNLPPKTLYGTFDQWKLKLERLNQEGYGIFVTVNKTGRSRKAEDLEEIRAVWLDYDNKDVPLPEDEEWPVQPHIKVETSP